MLPACSFRYQNASLSGSGYPIASTLPQNSVISLPVKQHSGTMKCNYIAIFFLVSLSAIFTNCGDTGKIKSNTDSYDERTFDTSNHVCSAGSELLTIGGYYKGHIDSNKNMVIFGSSFSVEYFTNIRGIGYGFCKHNDEINYISCNDKRFITDGIKVGDRYDDVKNHITDKTVYQCPGWGIYVGLRSGWQAYFGLPDEHSRKAEIADTARVICFFKAHNSTQFSH